MKWWLPVWVATSALLVLWASTVEYGAVVALIYIGLNVLGVAIVVSHRPPHPDKAILALGWCAAVQLPVLVVPLFDKDLMTPRGTRRLERGERPADPMQFPGGGGADGFGGVGDVSGGGGGADG